MTLKSRKLARQFASLFCAMVPWVAFAAQAQSSDTGLLARTDTASRGVHEKATQLQPIVVTGWSALQSYSMPQTSTATGTDTLPINIPQSIQVIPAQVLHDQAIQSLEGAVRNAPGVYVQQGEGNRDEFYIRGVKTKSDFFTDGLRDDTEYFRDLYNVAHVDVLQGPAAILFGRGGAGGIINLVTRQPERRRIRHASIETGSWGHLRGTLDVGGAIGRSGAFRVMAMGEDSGGFRDHAWLRRHAINPKVRFQLGDRTQLDAGLSYLDDRRFADRGIPSRNGRPVDVPRGTFFGSVHQNVAHSRVEAFNLRIRHQINDHLKVRNAFRVSDNERMYRNVYPASAVDDQDRLKLKAYEHPNNRLSYIDRAELIASFRTGALRHKLVLGSAYSWQRGNDLENLPGPSKTLPGTVPLSNPTVSGVAFPYLERNNHVVGKELGMYAEDQVSLGEHWKALVGARWGRFSVDAHYLKPGVDPDHTHNVDVDWSPRAGLIYKPVENDSVYASVTQTYTPQGANIALSQKKPEGAHLDPQKATNYEIGNKLDLFEGDLSLTAALFQLDLKNVVSKAADGSGRLVNTGAQRNRGFELSAEGAVTSSWSVYANYTRLSATITRTTKDAEAGAKVGLVPRNQFSIWTRHALNRHWGMAFGVRGESRKYTSYDNHVTLPGYAEADVMAYYQAHGYRVQLNVDNVTDKAYYPTASGDNQIMPGTPRNVTLRLSMDF
jgi:catecholate siderophore receptor